MAFTTNYQPNAYLLSRVGHDLGMAEFVRQEQEAAAREQAASLAQHDQQAAAERDAMLQQLAGEQRRPRVFVDHQDDDSRKAVLSWLAGEQHFGNVQDLQQQRFGQQDYLQQQRLQAEQERQAAVTQRAEMGNQTKLQRDRQNQIARQLDAEWQALLTHRNELSPEQWADVQQQFADKYSNMGLEPPVQVAGDQQQPEGQQRLDQYQKQWPHLPWKMGKDGEPELARGFRPEMDPDFQKQQQQHEIEKATRIEEAKTRVQVQAADIKEKQDTTKRAADNLADYGKDLAKARVDGHKLFVTKTESATGTSIGFDQKGFTEYLRQQEAALAAGYQIPGDKRQSVDGAAPATTKAAPTPVKDEEDARQQGLHDGTPIVTPDGRTGVWYN